jgi:GPH family glycoside/pentoside/hexuronide:cation symporter
VSTGVLPCPTVADTPVLAGTWAGVQYGALGFALAFLALPLYIVLPSHYAAQYGVPLTTLGLVLLATRVLDATLDPFIGQFTDGVFARSTRRAWWVAAVAAFAVSVGFTALFFPQVGASAVLAWLAGALLLTYVAFSVLSVTYQAWGTRLGGDTEQRARVVAWREGCGLVGVLAASALPSQLGMQATCMLLAVAMVIAVALLAGVPSAPSRLRVSAAHWTLPWRSAPFRRLLSVFMLNGIASAVPATLVLFFVRDRLQADHLEALFLSAYFAAAALSIPLWVRAVRGFGLVRTWLFGMGLAVVAFAWVLRLGVGDSAWFLAVCVVSGVALGADLTVPGALLTGVVQRAGHAAFAEGVYAGWWTSASKLNLGLAAGTALPLLTLAGYAPGQRDAQALLALSVAYVGVPCGLKLMAAALLWRGWMNTGAEE